MPSPLNKTIRIDSLPSNEPVQSFEDHRERLFANPDTFLSGIFQGDCLHALDIIPESKFELVIADPPYNLGRDFGNESDKRSESEYRAWTKQWIDKLARIVTPSGSIYTCCDWLHSGAYQEAIESAGFIVLNRITWKREKGRGAKKNWKQNMEDIWYAVRNPNDYTFNLENVKVLKQVIAPYRENGIPKDWIETETGGRFRQTHPSNIWTDMTVPFWSMPENTEHPTQKPEKLIERIVLASSNAGDRVLDLFSGSGTTSVVSERLGRKYLGIELNPDFVRLGIERLRREESAHPLEEVK